MKGSNMKKILTTIVTASMLISVPAYAERRQDGSRDRDHSQQERRKGKGCGWLCGAILGGIVVGVLASKERMPEEDNYQDYNDTRYYPPDYRYDRRYCVREQITEWRYGRRYVYWETTCN
jgi:hypothetical protein